MIVMHENANNIEFQRRTVWVSGKTIICKRKLKTLKQVVILDKHDLLFGCS